MAPFSVGRVDTHERSRTLQLFIAVWGSLQHSHLLCKELFTAFLGKALASATYQTPQAETSAKSAPSPMTFSRGGSQCNAYLGRLLCELQTIAPLAQSASAGPSASSGPGAHSIARVWRLALLRHPLHPLPAYNCPVVSLRLSNCRRSSGCGVPRGRVREPCVMPRLHKTLTITPQ